MDEKQTRFQCTFHLKVHRARYIAPPFIKGVAGLKSGVQQIEGSSATREAGQRIKN